MEVTQYEKNEKSSHRGEVSHLNEIQAEWYISLYKNKAFI